MDPNALVNTLRETLDPALQQEAEKKLDEVHKIIGFAPHLLNVVMAPELDMPVRQAGVIYLKNMVNQFWQDREVENPVDPVPFSIHEQDRAQIRDKIVEAVIHAPEPVRVQLTVCVSNIMKQDYPGRWPDVPEKIRVYLETGTKEVWFGSLLCLYQLVKNFEYKKPEERKPLTAAMVVLLPLCQKRCMELMEEGAKFEYAILIQKQILKIFYALVQYNLPLDLVPQGDPFIGWMELLRQILERPIPPVVLTLTNTYLQTNTIDEDELPEFAWWKIKKWALHVLTRCFERYGSPGNVTKEYNSFATWYLKSFSEGIIQVIKLILLDWYSQHNIYLAPRVMQQALNYLNTGVSHGWSWKFIKPHIQPIIQKVLFPIMCHTEKDDELWETDPYEYIRVKYDVFEDFVSPVTAAQTLLHSSVSKRKDILPKTMGFCMQLLSEPETGPRDKDGALHMIGSVADILLTKKIYKDQAEMMLANYVFREFQSSCGFLRARACWMLHHFNEVKFKDEKNLQTALVLTKNCLCGDKDLPVRVEAAIALQMLITSQAKAKDMMEPFVRPVILQLLEVIRETENDDLTGVMQKLVCTYVEQVSDIAVEMTQHLAKTFEQVILTDEDGSDEKAIAAMGILNTIDTILTVMDEQKEILAKLEVIVLDIIALILRKNVLEFYEEVLSLIYSLTCQQVSESMWMVFDMIYEMFQKDGFDYFTDMMPALHNYITVDSPVFMSKPKNLEIVFSMCKAILTGDAGEDAECHAAKLLEVVLLQSPGLLNDQVVTSFVELVLERLTREVRTSELRTMCLQVVVAALYCNATKLLEILGNMHEAITPTFLTQWLHDTDCFLGLHDRKVCVLGLCALMSTPSNRPAAINAVVQQIVPSALMLFSGLKRAYASRANEEDDENEENDKEDGEYEEQPLDSDEDEIDDEGAEYLEKLEKSANGDDDDSEYSDDGIEETALESYATPLDEEECGIDEYQIFQNILANLQATDKPWYDALVGHLNNEQTQQMRDVLTLADQRKAAAESKRIEEQGGYMFTQVAVPQNFNFSP
ncbi:importin-7-like [Lineus longissimus]|uniref:importin-7-like n=1 Tax=Lineus longissimus TaxID=88925 RepID=UPI002B4CAADE